MQTTGASLATLWAKPASHARPVRGQQIVLLCQLGDEARKKLDVFGASIHLIVEIRGYFEKVEELGIQLL
jgi:hypothetical protein